MPDELCEVAEICSGTSLIGSAIISCGVHHLQELRRKKQVVVVPDLLRMLHLERAFLTARDLPSFQ